MFRGRCHYDLRHDQTVSNLRAAIGETKADGYSPLPMRQARMARVALWSGQQEADLGSRMIAIAISAGTTQVSRNGAKKSGEVVGVKTYQVKSQKESTCSRHGPV